jgi:hypothetical protein
MAKRKTPTKSTTARSAVRKRTNVKAAQTSAQDLSQVKPSEQAMSKPQIISELAKSPHGNLAEYVPVGLRAAKEDPDFFAHLLAWNAQRGEVRDAKVALPVIALSARPDDVDYVENALAHLAQLEPRSFVRALDFARQMKAPSRLTRRLVKRYVRDLEADFHDWERAAVQHRGPLTELYTRFSIKPAEFADEALLKNQPKAGRLAAIKQLYSMSPMEAAGAIAKYRIPFLIARGALREKAKNTDLLLALINAMSPTELVNNTKNLQKLGVMDNPALRAAYDAGLKRVAEAKQPKASLKTTKAAEALAAAGQTQAAEKLKAVQEKQLDKLKGIEGDWLVLADKSGSMSSTIESGRQIAAILARMVKGKVYLVFFDTEPYFYDVTGKSLEQITALTKGMRAGGGTYIGAGMKYAASKGLHVDGIAIVSDGGENQMHAERALAFPYEYQKYVEKLGNEPTVYFYNVYGPYNTLSQQLKQAGVDYQEFDVQHGKVDYYSLPNLVQTMRVGRYSLLDEVLDTDLKKLDTVLKRTVGQGVVAHGTTVSAAV